jgi:hypothetical protein
MFFGLRSFLWCPSAYVSTNPTAKTPHGTTSQHHLRPSTHTSHTRPNALPACAPSVISRIASRFATLWAAIPAHSEHSAVLRIQVCLLEPSPQILRLSHRPVCDILFRHAHASLAQCAVVSDVLVRQRMLFLCESGGDRGERG